MKLIGIVNRLVIPEYNVYKYNKKFAVPEMCLWRKRVKVNLQEASSNYRSIWYELITKVDYVMLNSQTLESSFLMPLHY